MSVKERFIESGIAAIVSLITAGAIKKIDSEKGKEWNVDPDRAEELAKKIAPHWFGLGPEDEAMFNSALSKLNDRGGYRISKFLEGASKHDRARFIFIVTVLPDEKDRLQVLRMYMELTDEDEMKKLALHTRMISGGPGPIGEAGEKIKSAAQKIGKIYADAFWPWIKEGDRKVIEEKYPKTFALVKKIEEHRNRKHGWYVRLANKIIP